jgi:nucleotide-binding universal stress UspA family protein
MDLNQPASGAVRHSRAEPPSTLIDRADAGASTKAGPRRVLVATDTSETSAGAERAGIELSSRVGATLVFLSVIDTSRLRLPGGLFHTRVDQVRARRESALAVSVARARQLGIAAQFIIWEGDPGASIIDAAEAETADLIVIGSHGRGPVGRLLLGSVSSYVVDHGRMPVMVIRPGQHLDDVLAVTGADVGPTAFVAGGRARRPL